MTLDTFPSNVPTQDVGAAGQTKAAIIEAKFGDGYGQRTEDGLNSISQTWPLTWSLLTVAEADIIEGFLIAKKGSQAFLWTPPRASAPRKWVCKAWKRTPLNAFYDAFSCTFEEVFDL